MKILIITPRIPYPPFRGDKLKIYNIAKNLSLKNDVTIITFRRNDAALQELKNFDKYGIRILTVKLSVIESLLKTAAAVFSSMPFQTAFFRSSKMKGKINSLLNDEKFDVVYHHLIRSAQYLKDYPPDSRPLNVIDFTDAVSLYLKRFADIEKNPFKKFFLRVEQKRVEKYEKIAEKFHTLFICSEVDKSSLLKRGLQANIRILNNGIDTDYFNPGEAEFDGKRIIFTGNMPYHANYDAAIFFAGEIFPKILKEIPDAKFYIVGQKPPPGIRKLASDKIIVTGFVKDIKAEYLKSSVNVAPMRFGAGTLNKVIESIALGIPVVSTSIAVGGLPKELYKYIFVADFPEEFAQKVIKVMKDPSIRDNLMKEGREVIKDQLSWGKVVEDFEGYLLKEIGKLP